MRAHRWIPSGSGYWSYCKLCKIVKRVDGQPEAPCRGKTKRATIPELRASGR